MLLKMIRILINVDDEDDDAANHQKQGNTLARGKAGIVFSLIMLLEEVNLTLKDMNDNNGGGDEKYEDAED